MLTAPIPGIGYECAECRRKREIQDVRVFAPDEDHLVKHPRLEERISQLQAMYATAKQYGSEYTARRLGVPTRSEDIPYLPDGTPWGTTGG